MDWQNYIGEIIVGGFLLVLGLAFRNWANRLDSFKDLGKDIMVRLEVIGNKLSNRMDSLQQEVHAHRLEMENRVTKVETQVKEARRIHNEEDDA